MEEQIQEFLFEEDIPSDFTGNVKVGNLESICHFVNGKRHRLDGPAEEEYITGTNIWYKEGKIHRIGGPAIEYTDGSREWFVEGKMHRLDGPAAEMVDVPSRRKKEWWVEGKKYSKKKFDTLPEVIRYKAGLGMFV